MGCIGTCSRDNLYFDRTLDMDMDRFLYIPFVRIKNQPFLFLHDKEIQDGRLLGGDVKSIKCQMLSRLNVTSLSVTGHTTIKHQTDHSRILETVFGVLESLMYIIKTERRDHSGNRAVKIAFPKNAKPYYSFL